jgi:hypothetical protein
MSEEDLELLIAMDDPGEDTLEEDTFHQADNTVAHRPGQALPSRRRPDQRTEVIADRFIDPPEYLVQ